MSRRCGNPLRPAKHGPGAGLMLATHLRVSFEDATPWWSDQCAYPLYHAKDTFLTWRHVSHWMRASHSLGAAAAVETSKPALRTNDRQGRQIPFLGFASCQGTIPVSYLDHDVKDGVCVGGAGQVLVRA